MKKINLKLSTIVLTIGTLLFSCNFENVPDKAYAIVYSQYYAENYLKSPGTAEFGYAEAVEIDENTWKIEQSVDSQNTFGGIVRSYYSCTVKYNPKTKNYSMENFEIE